MENISTKFIRENYDIPTMAFEIEYKEQIDVLDFDFDNETPSQIWVNLHDVLDAYPEGAFINTESYGYDGGKEHIVYVNKTWLETEQETIARLKIVERAKRKEAKEIADAKKLLEIKD